MLQLRFVEPQLLQMDKTQSELLVIFHFEPKNALEAMPGIVDWRLCGMLSSKLKEGRFSGQEGEKILISTQNRFHFNKAYLIGLGKKEEFNPQKSHSAIENLYIVLEKEAVRSAIVSWPELNDKSTSNTTSEIQQGLLQIFSQQWTFLQEIVVTLHVKYQSSILNFLKQNRIKFLLNHSS